MLCHLSALAALIGVPFGNVLGPLLVWQIKKNEFPSVDVHGKAALNFQITVALATLASAILGGLLMIICVGWLFIALAILIGLAGLIANNGEDYKYPFSLNLIK